MRSNGNGHDTGKKKPEPKLKRDRQKIHHERQTGDYDEGATSWAWMG
jgi:hypothetical protein